MSNLTLEIEFIRKYPSGGCASEGEFDLADFVVKNAPECELPYKQVDDAFYHWQLDASLQRLEKINGIWQGYVAFIDIDAPEPGTSITLTVSLLEDD
ncbi:hypothetical protein [Vibrio harveyi]|uniref:hypothetical protein n=1 Tax=Vibrio harveyi TaxID=669 RepID=UPI000938738A|nr:hypothetical protein [Vibrio harveyi]APP09266.1 hypothetical protein BG259_28770 [Vibrio harveyi]